MPIQFEVRLSELSEFSELLTKYFHDKIIIGLIGELGAGKTTFTKSLVKSLGILDEVTSPTYSIENEYYNLTTQTLVRHIDLYRGLAEFEINEIFEPRNASGKEVIIIEWANLMNTLPKSDYLEMNFKMPTDIVENSRIVELTGNIRFLSDLEQEIQLKYGKK